MDIIIYRGTHEIGGTCIELKSSCSRIILDIGMPLIDKKGKNFNFGDYKDMPGQTLIKEGVLPNINGLYKWDNSNSVDGVFISHGHTDHYGLYSYTRPDINLFIGKAARELIELTNAFLSVSDKPDKKTFLKSIEEINCGNFKITPFLMDHSAFDAYAFVIEADGKKIIYTGDFRNHGRKSKAFEYFILNAPKDADALIIEGTMMTRNNDICKTEQEVETELFQKISMNNNLTVVYMSSQNIDRIVSLYKAVKRNGKILAVDIFTANVLKLMNKYAKIPCPSKEFPEIKVFYPKRLTKKMFNNGLDNLANQFSQYKVKKTDINSDAGKYVMVIRPSMLDDLKYLHIDKGLLIYSLWKGYEEEYKTHRLLEYVRSKNAEIVYIHTSGHATVKTIERVIKTLRPKNIIPVHTFNPSSFTEIMDNVILPSDNEIITLS